MEIRDTRRLMTRLDSFDPFMSSHQIIQPESPRNEVPRWAETDAGVQEVLLRAFPKLSTDGRQRIRAGRWARLIYYAYRMRMTRGQIAAELDTTEKKVKTMLYGINNVGNGRRYNGRGVDGVSVRKRAIKSDTPVNI